MYRSGGLPLISGICTQDFVTDTCSLETLDYYLYISTATISNLGVESSVAPNLPLRILFGLEQLLGVIILGIYIIVTGKKFAT